MSKTWSHRPPAAFRLDDELVIVDLGKGQVDPAKSSLQLTPEPETGTLGISVEDSGQWQRRGLPWGTLFWCATGGLILLAVGFSIVGLIEDLFARSLEIGLLGLALAISAAASLLVVVSREVIGLAGLATNEKLHQRAADTIRSDDPREGRAVGRALLALTRRMPRLARGRANLEGHLADIIDGADLVRLAERELMSPLDQQARRLIAGATTRVVRSLHLAHGLPLTCCLCSGPRWFWCASLPSSMGHARVHLARFGSCVSSFCISR